MIKKIYQWTVTQNWLTRLQLSTLKNNTILSVQFGHSVMSNSLRPHGLQHSRLPCASPTPGACTNSCPSSWWCHLTISSSVIPSPPAFNLSQHQGLFQWVSSLHQVAKVLELQLQDQSFQWMFRDWFPLGLTGLISFQPKELSRSSPTTVQKHHQWYWPWVFFFGSSLVFRSWWPHRMSFRVFIPLQFCGIVEG